MKPSLIKDVLDLTREIKKNNKQFVPLFQGPPGIAKSQVCQQWAKENNLPLIDIRLAYLESPDMIGFPSIESRNGTQVTVHNTPEMWPQDPDWVGLILFEEPNRGTTAVMNTMMQILTDNRVGKYELPKGAILAACINPEDSFHDVNTMDTALRNRFQVFNIEYSKVDFVKYMKESNFHKSVISYVETNTFKYKKPEDIGTKKGDQYNSPRTLEALSNSLNAGLPSKLQDEVFDAILGRTEGASFYAFYNNEQPVTLKDLKTSFANSIQRLKQFSNPDNYKMGHISITCRDIVENIEESNNALLKEVILSIPADQGVALLNEIEYKTKNNNFTQEIVKEYPEIKKHFKHILF